MPKTRGLTPKQQKFIEEYLIDLNATQAAIRAGYSARRADAIGFENLRKPDIIDAIQAERQEQSKRTQITADWVLMRLREEATNSKENCYAPARVKALELLGKHLALFTDKLEHHVAQPLPDWSALISLPLLDAP
jgi:phage terminase small subunit